jgi:valyl-tRNA synthetase
MIMMGLEDTSDVPFHTVYLHGLIRDERGEKMSKVKGNVINPIDTLEQYGTDALRFAVITGTSPGNDSKLTPSKLEAGRNFANKLWNATRFVVRSITEGQAATEIQRDSLPVEDRWILSRLASTIATVSRLMEDFQFAEAQRQIHDFLWGAFCDWYVEIAKVRLHPDAKALSPIPVLVHVLETSLRLLHPYMPFVTEELWQNLKRRADLPSAASIMVAPYPDSDQTWIDPGVERVMESIIEIIHSIRNARAQYKVASSRWIEVQIFAGGLTPAITAHLPVIQTLARARPVTLLKTREDTTPVKNNLVLVLKDTEVVIPMESMVDLEAEKTRLRKEIAQARADLERLSARLSDSTFLSKAPATVVDKEREKLAERQDKLARLEQQLAKLT